MDGNTRVQGALQLKRYLFRYFALIVQRRILSLSPDSNMGEENMTLQSAMHL